MRPLLLIVWIFLFLFTFQLQAQDDVKLFNFWEYYSDIENSLHKHFCSVAIDQLNERKGEIEKLETKDDWLERQSIIRDKFAKILGPFPEKTTLNAQITGIIKRDGYRIEKIIYESIPNYYVTGLMYIPNGTRKKAPAIFYTCGHSKIGFRYEGYQHIPVNLVKKGFVVFTIDPMGQGERYEYWDLEANKPRFPVPDHEHSYAGAQCLLGGYSTGRYFIWDLVRGVDYMLSRKEVDAARIGMTGGSGGGNTTAYMGAFDNRLLATAPERYITSYEHIVKSIGPQCAEQNLYKMISEGLDHADFLMARAPKPTMIITTTRDFFPIQGAKNSYIEAKKMYDAFDAGDMLTMVEDDTVHRSTRNNREAMYGFFQKHLNNPGSPEDIDVEILDPEELQISPKGQLAYFEDAQSVFSLNREIVEKQEALLNKNRHDITNHLKNIPVNATKYAGFDYPISFEKSDFSGRYVKSGYILEKYLIPGSGNYVLPAVLLKPVGHKANKAVLYLDSKGIEHAVNQESIVHGLVQKGYPVFVVDLPGIGSMGPGFMKGDSYIQKVSYNQWFTAVLAGKSNVGLRAEDIIRIVNFINNDIGEFPVISAISSGPLGAELLHAAVIEPEIQEVCLDEAFLSYTGIATTRFYEPGFIPHTVAGTLDTYDLPDLMAALSPRNLLVLNPRQASGEPAKEDEIQKEYAFPFKVYDVNTQNNFNVINTQENDEKIKSLLLWLGEN
ncbi:alpha/beta hydrolase family protein [Bacteroidota bacterium]